MNGYLLDTHVWLWYLRGDESLAARARSHIESSLERCWLSPVSVWETGLLHQRGRIRIRGDFRGWVQDARKTLPLQPAPLNTEVAVSSLEVDLPHPDPADRFLAATARTYDLTLITADRRLLDSPSVETLSARH
ncbi:MAG: type II toxin-antitoxin system VapC family toxin [Acidobacteriota bacterium]